MLSGSDVWTIIVLGLANAYMNAKMINSVKTNVLTALKFYKRIAHVK